MIGYKVLPGGVVVKTIVSAIFGILHGDNLPLSAKYFTLVCVKFFKYEKYFTSHESEPSAK